MSDELKKDEYLLGEYEGKVFIKMIGNCTMKNSKTLEKAIDGVFKGKETELVLDMESCNYVDSTMLGLIAKSAIKMKKLWNKKIYAINPPNLIFSSLKSTGIDKILEVIQDKEVENIKMEALKTEDFSDKVEKTKHILDAHKTLMELNDDNKRVFVNVVNLLEKELDK